MDLNSRTRANKNEEGGSLLRSYLEVDVGASGEPTGELGVLLDIAPLTRPMLVYTGA